MIPRRIAGATHQIGAAEGETRAIVPIWARVTDDPVNGRVFDLAWEPTPEELAMLAAGGSVVVSIFATRLPPSFVSVELHQGEGS